MSAEEHPIPRWDRLRGGTGGTSATIGRFIAYQRHATQLCVADPVHSVFHRHFADRSASSLPEGCASCIEGIGRPRVEPSFIPSVIDRMIAVEDAASIGAMRALSARLGRRVGGSTARTSSRWPGWSTKWRVRDGLARSLPSCATAASVTVAPIMTTTGWTRGAAWTGGCTKRIARAVHRLRRDSAVRAHP